MIFSSLLFMFRFLPAVLLVYYMVSRPWRNLILLLFSLVFYAWGEPVYLLLMVVSILVSYLGGLYIDRFKRAGRGKAAKTTLVISSVISLLLLAFFKYADFSIGTVNAFLETDLPTLQIALPVGISFYTFQTMSYTVDVYRGEAKVQNHLISFGAYVTMFPQLIAGPIVQYKTIDTQLRFRRETPEQFAEGIHRFMTGLGKKVLIANNIGELWTVIQSMNAADLPVLTAWMGLAAYTFQIYFDFSAYSDMAIGLGRMFGFQFLENFNYPYISKSITEFWRRWHISLGTWFREYVYIPLGGNRVGHWLHIRNILTVWLLTGIWHGASWNFALWGVYYGILLLMEKLVMGRVLEKLPDVFRHIYCIFFIMLGWNLFVFDEIGRGLEYGKALFGIYGKGILNGETIYFLYNHGCLLFICMIGCTHLPRRMAEWLFGKLVSGEWAPILIRIMWYGCVFFLSVSWLVDASFQPFLYFRF